MIQLLVVYVSSIYSLINNTEASFQHNKIVVYYIPIKAYPINNVNRLHNYVSSSDATVMSFKFVTVDK